MLGFLAPLWLAGFASLAVPLVLHLWSRRTGRALRVGSIQLLTGAPPPMARRPRLHDPWLLLLRCAMLAALVLALARPFWMPRRRAAPIWALVATDVVERARLVDSLERRGQTVRALDPTDLWLSLMIADRTAPLDARFEVYATPLLRGARGTRPVLRSAVSWHPRPSTPRETGPAAATSPARIVTVFADPSRTDDARYIAAAVRAVGSVSGIPAIVATRAPAAADVASVRSSDWIVWLSNEPLAGVVQERLRAGATVLTDVGRIPASETATRVAFEPLVSRTSGVRRSLERALGAPVWTDVTGAPLLTVAREGRGLRYRFQSRFAPSWSDIVLDPAFPEAIAPLWIGADSTRLERDDRPIALSQVLPAYDPQPSARAGAAGARSLFLPLWLIALGLFLTERRSAARGAVR
jgi:aerotolerance regulator-like protein